MLSDEGVEAGYGDGRVLFGMNSTAAAGEVVPLIGRSGMGGTATVRTVMRLPKVRSGPIPDQDLRTLAPHAVARRGIRLVLEDRRVFPPH